MLYPGGKLTSTIPRLHSQPSTHAGHCSANHRLPVAVGMPRWLQRYRDFALAAQQDDAPAALHPAGELRGAVFLAGAAGRHGENIAPNPRAPDRVGQDGPMADYTHTIDRWDDATVRRRRLPGGGEALAKGQDHAAQPGAGAREELAG